MAEPAPALVYAPPDGRPQHVHAVLDTIADSRSTGAGADVFGGSMLVAGRGGLTVLSGVPAAMR